MPERVAVLLPDVRKMLEGFDLGIFVRSIEGDGEPGWALRLAPYLAALGRLARAVEAEPEPLPGDEQGAGVAEDLAFDAARERGYGSVRGPD